MAFDVQYYAKPEEEWTVLNYNLVNLIQYHSDRLAASLLRQVEKSERAPTYCNVSPMELKDRVHEIYRHLGAWLVDKSKSDVEQRYMAIGARRTEQNVALSELVWVILLTKRNLIEFINEMSFPGRPADISEKRELLQRIDEFFDCAVHAAVVGHEYAAEGDAKNKKAAQKAS